MVHNTLIHRYLLGDVTEEDVRQLDGLLKEKPEFRHEFVVAAATDVGLRELAFERAAESMVAKSRLQPKSRLTWLLAGALVAALAVIAAFAPAFIAQRSVATLVSSENAAWESPLPTTPGSELTPGVLQLKSGIATLQFHSGAEVILESPSRLEVISSMRGRLLDGAAVIEVPKSAVGFVIETPDGYAVDYGTRFAVRVDPSRGRSDFELIEGEIGVHHMESGDEVRITEPHRCATVSNGSVSMVDMGQQDPLEGDFETVIRIGTNGRATSVLPNNKRKFIDPEVLSVKKTENGKWNYRSFFAFDLTATDLTNVTTARLRLNLIPSRRGLASRLPPISRFGVYGLTNPDKADWGIDSAWEDSPAPEDGVLLETFDVPRSEQRGTFGITNEQLLNYLRENAGQSVTLILVRETTQLEGEGPGLTHMFATDLHPEAVGPLLELTLQQ